MQQLNDQAIILRVSAYGEYDALVSAFGREQGLLSGIVKRGLSSKQRGVFCLGNTVDLEWSARLEEHLGTLKGEMVAPGGTIVMGHRTRCYALQSMCALVQLSMQLRDPHPSLYRAMERLIESMRFDLPWQADYARFEAVLLREAGFGLGLEQCIVSGTRENLRYISPKSGCAVSATEGAPYHAKLFDYPALLTQEMHVEAPPESVNSALEVTGHFMKGWLLASLERPEPAARARLVASLQKNPAAA